MSGATVPGSAYDDHDDDDDDDNDDDDDDNDTFRPPQALGASTYSTIIKLCLSP